MNLGAHSRDRRFSTPVSATPNRESDFSNLSFHRSVEIRTAALAPLLASSHSQRVADLGLHHEPSLSCGNGRPCPKHWNPESKPTKPKATGPPGRGAHHPNPNCPRPVRTGRPASRPRTPT